MRYIAQLRTLAEEQGSALITTLVVLTLLTLMVGLALGVYLLQRMYVRLHVHEARAQYEAEAGVFQAIAWLQNDPTWTARDTLVVLPGGMEVELSVEPFGGYLLVRSVAVESRSKYAARALIGEVPGDAFEHALTLWDYETRTGLSLNGAANVYGDLSIVAPKGREVDSLDSNLDGIGYNGELIGAVYRFDSLQVGWDRTSVERARLLRSGFEPGKGVPEDTVVQRRSLAEWMPSELPETLYEGDIVLDAADPVFANGPRIVTSTGALTIVGDAQLPKNTTLVAETDLRIEDDVQFDHALLLSGRSVTFSGSVFGSAQVLAGDHVIVADSSVLAYPSAVYVSNATDSTWTGIEVRNQAEVHGTLLYPHVGTSSRPARTYRLGRVSVADSALVRGGIYGGQETELHGRLWGSLAAFRTYFYYESALTPGVHKENWLRNADIDLGRRPVNYLTPVGFSSRPTLGVLDWEGVATPLYQIRRAL
ncbi:MAG: hypothetical protein AAF752_05180 [Bacteroidota bacterium]